MNSARIFHRLVSIEEAIRKTIEIIEYTPGIEIVELENALYRVLAEDIYSPIDYPPFDRSDVDGYAVRSLDISHVSELNPVTSMIRGEIKPGDVASDIYSCVDGVIKVSTGSMIPRDCDAVVMEEYTESSSGYVKIYRPVAIGENISTAGSDVSTGDLLIPRGILLRHEHISLLAGLGFSRVRVYRKPRSITYSTGSEVVKPGEVLTIGKIYDVNGYMITSFLREQGVDAVYSGILPDNYELIKENIERNIEKYDMVFISGGTSAGERDLVYRVLEDIGEIIVHGLKSKPGKPTVIAKVKGKLVIGLPGFPLSCYMILTRVIKPIITRYTGLRIYENRVSVKIPFKIRKGVGKTWLIPSILVESREGLVAYPVSLSSGSIYAITYSDGFVEVGEEVDVVETDRYYPFYAFSERTTSRRLTIIGSNDPLLEHLLLETGLIYTSRVLNVGSMGGLIAASRGEADIAPTHVLDPETRVYNVFLLDRYGIRDKVSLIRGYDRLIGFIVNKGNPKNIRSFRDFFREDVRVVNRPRGSGIRSLIDINLEIAAREIGLDISNIHRFIKGYFYEVKTHTAVATVVKYGKADVGVATGYVAEIYGLDFIPLTWEEFDFFIPRDRLNKPEISRFLSILRELRYRDIRYEFKAFYRIPDGIGLPRE